MRRLFSRAALAAGVLALAVAAGGIAARPVVAQSSPPARYTGTINLFGAKPTGSGLTLKAYVGSTECGTGKITGGTYTINVSSAGQKTGCGTPGAQVQFTIGQYYAYEIGTWAMGYPQEVNLTGPVTTGVNLTADCDNEVQFTFASKTPMTTVIDSILPKDVIDSIWFWDGKNWQGYYTDSSSGPSTLKTVELNKKYWVCSYEAATMAMPLLSPSASTTASVPDLTLFSVAAAPNVITSGASAGTQITYTTTLRNQGQGDATGVKVVTYLPSGLPAGTTVPVPTISGFSCTVTGAAPSPINVTCEGGSLSGNGTITLNVRATLGGTAAPGAYIATVVVDPENTVAEADNGNNQRTVTVTVT